MSTPGLVPFIEDRSSAQNERPGAINVNDLWFRNYCGYNPARIFHGWEGLHPLARRSRAQCHFPFGLKEDVVDKICKLPLAGIKRLVNLVTGLQDVLLFSDPEGYPLRSASREYELFLKWAISTDVYRPGETTREWKAFITLVKWRAVQSRTEPPELPKSFPGIPRNGISPRDMKFPIFWFKLTPWLYPIWYHGLQTKMDCTRLAHLLTSRNLPASSIEDRQKTLKEHAEVLCGDPGPENPARAALLHEFAFQAGEAIRAKHRVTLNAAHTSLTNSASLDNPVNAGGRARGVAERFRSWLSEISTEDIREETWFGRPYWLQKGVARWRTLCRDSIAADGRPGDSSFIEEVDFTPGKYKYEDPLYCLDRWTGYQLFQWSIEEGIRTGSIVGSPFYKRGEQLVFSRPPAIRASAIGEPGNKSRVVTVGEDWLTIFLQPLSHAIIDNLRHDGSARAGLSRAWQGFEFTKSWSTKDRDAPPSQEERLILTSDLKTATDFCPRLFSRALLQGFTLGLGLNGPLTDLWIDLVTGPRIYQGPVEDFTDTLTKRGVLMGDPGSKIVLSLFNKVAEMEAMLRYQLGFPRHPSCKYLLKRLREEGVKNTRFRLFAFSGDDHIAIGPEEYLREITRSHVRNGMKVSLSSNFISEVAGFYCEETLFIRDPKVWACWGNPEPLKNQQYADNPHVDALKIRLFSLCSKEHEGKNETNPAIGMSRTLRGMVAWFKEGWETTRALCTYRFQQKMRKLLPENLILQGAPQSLGGVEAPLFGYSKEELTNHWKALPDPIRRAISLVRTEGADPEVQALRRVLSRVSSDSTARGVDLSNIEEEIRRVLSSELCQAHKIEDLRPTSMTEEAWENLKLRDKLNVVSRQGKFIPVGEALQVVNRPYIFRDLLFPEESIAHGIDPFRKRAYRQLSWKTRIDRLLLAISETINGSESLKEKYLGMPQSVIEETAEALITSFTQDYLASVPRETILVPREVVYTDKLCTLTVPDMVVLP